MRISVARLKTNAGGKWMQRYAALPVWIWSNQWGAYWRSNSAGYTYERSCAGIYSLAEAFDACAHGSPEKRLFVEIAMKGGSND